MKLFILNNKLSLFIILSSLGFLMANLLGIWKLSLPFVLLDSFLVGFYLKTMLHSRTIDYQERLYKQLLSNINTLIKETNENKTSNN